MLILAALALILILIKGSQLLFVRQAGRKLTVSLELDQNRLQPGQTLTLLCVLENDKLFLLPSVTMTLTYPSLFEIIGEPMAREPAKGQTQTLTLSTSLMPWQKKTRKLQFRALQRGSGEFRLSCDLSDLFDTVTLEGPDTAPRLCLVHPLGQLTALTENQCGLQGEKTVRRWLHPDPLFYTGVRPYQSQDSFKDIDWKATARLSTLQVKQYDTTADPAYSLFLAVHPYGSLFADDPAFIENAVQTAAGLLRLWQSRQIPAAVMTNSVIRTAVADTSFCDSSRNHYVSCLDLLACVTPYPLYASEHLFRRFSGRLNGHQQCLILTRTVDETLWEILNALHHQRIPVTLITPEPASASRLPSGIRVLTMRKEADSDETTG